MTEKQFDKFAERLADRHGLSQQLTLAWLRDGGYDKLSLHYGLSPYELGVLRAFAKVES